MISFILAASLVVGTNNPGNITKGSNWKGEVACEGRFECFKSPKWGVRAMVINLRTYYVKHNLHTIKGIISRWAPPTENPTDNYIKYVASVTNYPADKPFAFSPAFVGKMVMAMIRMESGHCLYSKQFVQEIVNAYTFGSDDNAGKQRIGGSPKDLGHEDPAGDNENRSYAKAKEATSRLDRAGPKAQPSGNTVDKKDSSNFSLCRHNCMAAIRPFVRPSVDGSVGRVDSMESWVPLFRWEGYCRVAGNERDCSYPPPLPPNLRHSRFLFWRFYGW